MDARDLRGMAVVTMDGAERLGRVRDVLFQTDPLRATALALDTDRGERTVALSDIDRIGDDAIIAETRAKAVSGESRIATEGMPGIQALGTLKVVDDTGTFMGQIESIEIDPGTGQVGAIDVTRSNAFGIGGETTTVRMDQIRSVGDELLTVTRT